MPGSWFGKLFGAKTPRIASPGAIPETACLRLCFALETHIEDSSQANRLEPVDERTTLEVTLGNGFFIEEHGNKRTIYDFDTRRILSVDLALGCYIDDSLFKEIAFRHFELLNRAYIREVLRAGGAQGESAVFILDPIFSEHELAVCREGSSARFDQKRDRRNLAFHAAGYEFFAQSHDKIALSEVQAGWLTRFFRYCLNAHPILLDQLRTQRGVPETMRLTHYTPPNRTTSLRLVSIEPRAIHGYSMEGLRLAQPAAERDDLLDWIQSVRAQLPSGKEERNRAIIADAEQAFAAGEYLDTLLAQFEYSLQNGPLLPGAEHRRDVLDQDTHVARLKTALQTAGESRVATERAAVLDELVDLRDRTRKPHVLMLMEGGLRRSMMQTGEDRETLVGLYREALGSNPFITGAYHDLAKIFASDYKMAKAWQCWDLARQLAPEHPMLHEVNALEAMLSQQYPEYF
jgi:hypothetical protein